jgi:guanylate kinase
MFLKYSNPHQVKNMISPKVYQKQIQDLEIEGKEIYPQNNEEAKIIFDELISIEKILERIRYNIRMDTRAIRKEYMTKIKEIGDSSKFKDKISKRPLKNKIKEKRVLIDERDLKIAPYESIEYMIDDYLRQISDSKKYLTNYSRNKK